MNLHWETVTPLLKKILIDLMNEDLFNPFRLVGGTALSLQIGHRISVDIDLFSDAEYDSIDFNEIENFLQNNYSYCSTNGIDIVGFGKSYFVGNSENDCIKLDLYYTDDFVYPETKIENIRLATKEEIIAMKLDVISRNGRRKDFWDLHYFLNDYSYEELFQLYKKRYPYSDETINLKEKLIDFEIAEYDFEPNCLLDKNWEFIKLDFFEKFSN